MLHLKDMLYKAHSKTAQEGKVGISMQGTFRIEGLMQCNQKPGIGRPSFLITKRNYQSSGIRFIFFSPDIMGFQTSSVKLGAGGQKGPLGDAAELHCLTILLPNGASWEREKGRRHELVGEMVPLMPLGPWMPKSSSYL